MDVNGITTLIGSLGFPIVACGAMFWQNIRQSKDHKEEMNKLAEAVNNNTTAITKLVEHLDK